MKIYDISQELFSGKVFPGDPEPSREQILHIAKGDVCNLSKITACAHNATHLDAPRHFFNDGIDVAGMDLSRCLGPAIVVECDTTFTADTVHQLAGEGHQRILIKGQGVITVEAAEAMVSDKILLIGVEPQTVGVADTVQAVHKILLGHEMVILEGLVLRDVPVGKYMLSALPLKLAQCDGSPVRAVLYQE